YASPRSEETYVSNVVESGRKARPPSPSENEDSASSSQRSSWFPPRISTCWLKLMRCCSSCRNVPGRNDRTSRGRVDRIHVRVEHLLERVDIGGSEPVRGRRRVHVDGDVRAHRLGSRGHRLVGSAIEAGAHREGAEAAQRRGCHGRDPGARGGGS